MIASNAHAALKRGSADHCIGKEPPMSFLLHFLRRAYAYMSPLPVAVYVLIGNACTKDLRYNSPKAMALGSANGEEPFVTKCLATRLQIGWARLPSCIEGGTGSCCEMAAIFRMFLPKTFQNGWRQRSKGWGTDDCKLFDPYLILLPERRLGFQCQAQAVWARGSPLIEAFIFSIYRIREGREEGRGEGRGGRSGLFPTAPLDARLASLSVWQGFDRKQKGRLG